MNDALVLFHDVDGCLNPPDGAPLPLYESECISTDYHRLGQFGELLDNSPVTCFVLNTGRSWQATHFLCQAINSGKLRYALVEHGAQLWDVRSQTPVDIENLDHSILGFDEALASRNRLQTLVEWFDEEGSRQLAERMSYAGALLHQPDKSWNLTFAVPGELDGDEVFAQLQSLISSSPDFAAAQFTYHYSRWNRFIDVMGGMDKGLGMAAVMALLGLSNPHTAAIGDGLNDLSMLQQARTPVCPANAEPAVIDLCGADGYVSDKRFIAATEDWLSRL